LKPSYQISFFKKLLPYCILFPFLLLFVQQSYPFVSLKPLHGDFVPASRPGFNFADWFNGDYQKKIDSFLNDNFGFRNVLVRTNNQIKFSLFKTTTTSEVVIGKLNYLYIQGYINGYYGFDFLGDGAINDTITKLKSLQETLKAMGKTLLVVLAPSKARIYPEYIPDRFSKNTVPNSNYASYVRGFKRSGINYIDFNAIFLKKKNISPYLLIPQLGVHWSRLEAVRAYDTIMKQLSYLANVKQPGIKITEIKEKDELIDPDNDVIEGMNLLAYPKYEKMSYPTFEYENPDRPQYRALTISDSYWWDIYLLGFPKNCFKSNEFWYYFKDVWGSNFIGKKEMASVDLKRRLLQQDFIIIICSESNLGRFGFGFPGAALSALNRMIIPTREELLEICQAIKADSDWMKQIQSRALKTGSTLENAILEDANWIFQKRGPVVKEITLEDMKAYIRKDEYWMKEINRKAAERGITLDSMVIKEAIWQMESNAKGSEKNTEQNSLTKMKEYIRGDKVWMLQIKKKAASRNISVDSMVLIDALWVIEQEKIKKNKN
jgi:hypothetical protein